ncbi:MAG: HutD family protein [Bdellovibrionia bacterium]
MASSRLSAIVLRKGDSQKMPWKNGQGSTSEIAIYPIGTSLSENSFLWRLSSAEITTGGSFSLFPGYERYLGLVKGDGLQLNFEPSKRQILLQRGKVCRFSGTDVVSSSLSGGPVEDLNLIYSTSRVKAVFEAVVLRSKPRSFGMTGTVGFIYCVEGSVSASVFPGEIKFLVPEGDILRVDLPQTPSPNEGLILVEPVAAGTDCKLILIELSVQF